MVRPGEAVFPPENIAYDKWYVNEYTGNRLIDAMITVYFISVGDFSVDNFKESPNSTLIWPMFLICNFLIAIVFMNMLIAMMGNTFGEVYAQKQESELEQQIQMISDYEDLVNIKERF